MRSACTKAVVGVAEQAGEIASSIHAPNDCVVDVTRQRQGAVWSYSEYELRVERCIEERAAGQGEGDVPFERWEWAGGGSGTLRAAPCV